jgi:phenylpyruvate tautomerase PptA (4-oxalocrotonate tautomerase family)
MPLLTLFTSAEPPAPAASDALLKHISASLAQHIGKPEAYVMTNLVPRTRMTFAGTTEPACYVEIKNVGRMTPEQTEGMSRELGALIAKSLGVPTNRMYIEFSDAAPHLWGFDGGTFA